MGESGLLPLVTAIVVLLATWLKEASHRRGREQVHQRMLAQVKEELTLIDVWVKARGSFDPSGQPPLAVRERAIHDLDAAYGRLQQFDPEVRKPITFSTVVSRLLLRHLPVTVTARVLRIIYYLTLVAAIVWGAVGFSLPTSWSSVNASATTVITYIIVAVIPALFFGWLTTYVTKRQAAFPMTSGPPTLAS